MNRIRSFFKIFWQDTSFIIAFVFVVNLGCHPGMVIPAKVTVFSEKSLHPYYRSAKLAIVPFNTAMMGPDLGITMGKIFEIEMAKRHFFESIILIEDTPWDKQLTIRDQKIQAAIFEAQQRKADLLLWGDVENYHFGILSHPEVTINVMLIDVRSSSLLWWGRGKTSGVPGNRFLFWGQTTPDEAPPVGKLIEKVTEKVIDNMVSTADQFWGKTIVKRYMIGLKKLVTLGLSEQEGQEGKEHISIENPIQEAQRNEFKEDRKDGNDIIDDALGELESIILQ